MQRLSTDVWRYCETHTTPVSETLYALERETYLKTMAPQMISGHLQGQLLSLISKLTRPRFILEIGTFTGYSAICLAQGLADGGMLHTIEANREMGRLIRKYVQRAGLEEKITLHLGDAKAIIPTLSFPWDLAFIDAAKLDYIEYYDLIIEQLRPGGIILADNVLWSGKVLQPKQDPEALVLHKFNQKTQSDERVENVLLPLRDGLMMIRKL